MLKRKFTIWNKTASVGYAQREEKLLIIEDMNAQINKSGGQD